MAGWERLMRVLGEQLDLYQAMLHVGEKKSQCIVDGKVRELECLVRAEEGLLARAGRLEGALAQVHRELVEGLMPQEIVASLAALLAHAPDQLKEELGQRESQLLAIIDQLAAQNQLNRELLNNALRLVNYQLSLLAPESSGVERRPYLDRKA